MLVEKMVATSEKLYFRKEKDVFALGKKCVLLKKFPCSWKEF